MVMRLGQWTNRAHSLARAKWLWRNHFAETCRGQCRGETVRFRDERVLDRTGRRQVCDVRRLEHVVRGLTSLTHRSLLAARAPHVMVIRLVRIGRRPRSAARRHCRSVQWVGCDVRWSSPSATCPCRPGRPASSLVPPPHRRGRGGEPLVRRRHRTGRPRRPFAMRSRIHDASLIGVATDICCRVTLQLAAATGLLLPAQRQHRTVRERIGTASGRCVCAAARSAAAHDASLANIVVR